MMRPAILNPLFKPLTSLKGVGEKMGAGLHRLVPPARVRELLFHLPVSVIDRRQLPALTEVESDSVISAEVTVEGHEAPPRGSRRPYKVLCRNATGFITVVYFNGSPNFVKGLLPVGAKRVISGRVERTGFGLQMAHPDMVQPPEKRDQVLVVEPRYGLSAGLNNGLLRKLLTQILPALPTLPEWINPALKQERNWPDWVAALRALHDPDGVDILEPAHPARQRLAYDELLAHQLALGLSRTRVEKLPGVRFLDSLLEKSSDFSNEPNALRATKEPSLLAREDNMVRNNENNEVNVGSEPAGEHSHEPAKQRSIANSEEFAGSIQQKLISALPFTLTAGQRDVLGEINADVTSGHRMVRLLQGDVGSGKTVVALLAMMQAVESGFQAALMAPTEILARQHGAWIAGQVAQAGLAEEVRVAVLTGRDKGAARAEIYDGLKDGGIQIVIGTHALFQEQVQFKQLGLVVVDEQHRFGVRQRMALAEKGEATHLLLMSATPIPRTLTLTLYGDMALSILAEKPAGRQKIDTRVMSVAKMDALVAGLKRAVAKGERVYWVCPLIEAQAEDERALDEAAAEERYRSLKGAFSDSSRDVLPEHLMERGSGLRSPTGSQSKEESALSSMHSGEGEDSVPPPESASALSDSPARGELFIEPSARAVSLKNQEDFSGDNQIKLIHGRMSGEEKDAAMAAFKAGEAQILVATTVIEVGVDVPEATIMVIERAERFGLSQLHQLRGRIGRGHAASTCILLYGEGLSEAGQRRLGILRETEDGFRIAEEDLALRGSGELTGTRQSGFPQFQLAELPAQQDLLFTARDDAAHLLTQNPELTGERGGAVRLLLELFEYDRQVKFLTGG